MDNRGKGKTKWSKTKDLRIVGFVDSRQPFPVNGARNAYWYFLASPLRCRDSVSVRIT
jgi:hypothetical protein